MAIHSQTKIANDQHFTTSATIEIDETSDDIEVLTTSSSTASIAVKGVFLSSDAASGRIRLFFQNDEDSAENTIAVLYADGEAGYIPVLVKGDPGESVYVDTDIAVGPNFVLINYREE